MNKLSKIDAHTMHKYAYKNKFFYKSNFIELKSNYTELGPNYNRTKSNLIELNRTKSN